MAHIVYLKIIQDLAEHNLQEWYELLTSFDFDVAKGVGFIHTDLDDNYLSSKFVLRKNISRNLFDYQTNSFTQQDSYYFEEIPFGIDGHFTTLDIFSNLRNTHQLITHIGKLTKFQYTIADFDVNPANVLDLVTDTKTDFKLEKFSISHLVVKPGISGTYSAKVSDQQNALQIIQNQKTDVSKIGLKVDFLAEENVALSINRSGGFHISCREDSLLDVLQELKMIFFRRDKNHAR